MTNILGIEGFSRCLQSAGERGEVLRVSGASDSFVQLALASMIAKGTGLKILCILPSQPKVVNAWLAKLQSLLQTVTDVGGDRVYCTLLPALEHWGNERFALHTQQREMRLLSLGIAAHPAHSAVLVTTMEALSQKTLGRETYDSSIFSVRVSQEISQEALVSALTARGYHESVTVDEPGAFTLRGGILDVFPTSLRQPVRIEFFGDEIQSMRFFSTESQRSIQDVDTVQIALASENHVPPDARADYSQLLYNALVDRDFAAADREGIVSAVADGTASASTLAMFAPWLFPGREETLRFFDATTVVVFPFGYQATRQSYEEWREKVKQHAEKDIAAGRPVLDPEEHFAAAEAWQESLKCFPRQIEFHPSLTEDPDHLVYLRSRSTVEGAPLGEKVGAERFDQWVDVLSRIVQRQDGSAVILVHQAAQVVRIATMLRQRGFQVVETSQPVHLIIRSEAAPGAVYIGLADLSQHLWLEETSTLVLPETELVGVEKKAVQAPSAKLQNYLSSFRDLKVGDLVVHLQHGIGQYCGITTLGIGGVSQDFLIVEYAGGDRIYVPVDMLKVLQRYATGEQGEHTPGLDRLKSQSWEKRKSRVKKAIRDMAEQLVRLSARRKLASAPQIGALTELYYNFEAGFPFEETPDQLRAIDDVNADLSSAQPMDRLVCGDVGFGKTEVAMRAAFRAVLDGFQVVVLVPTTVLCFQHFRTLSERFGAHGIKVVQLSRFVKPLDAQRTLKEIEQGSADIVVGTHRVLSKDLRPKRLGLLVVDEEQRFGVAHKERIKEMKAGVHVLTMTATPIPRTLHMAMIGMRDISIIATPPENRLSVRTYLSPFDEELVRDSIDQELQRGGQVFFVHNRVEDIEQVAGLVTRLVPKARVRFAHGQMPETQLETVIMEFLDQKFDVLVCTTIIESGVDMPNVNTLIVHHAERFGLAQLYQLRGRVGRSSTQAYAYFLTDAGKSLPDDARRRLEVLANYQELGAGFQIASHDLELRGAGNLLGGEQSGHVGEVGLELYTDMLDRAIHEIRGEKFEEPIDPEIKLPVTALIRASYIERESQRLAYYKSLFSVTTADEVATLREEMTDRYGAIPSETENLFKIAMLKQTLIQMRVRALNMAGDGRLELRFADLREEIVSAAVRLIQRDSRSYELAGDGRLLVRPPLGFGFLDKSVADLQQIQRAIEDLGVALGLLHG